MKTFPLPRFRLRTLMVAVAIMGLACGGEAMRRRRAAFLARAEWHEGRSLDPGLIFTKEGDLLAAKPWAYHRDMAAKYEQAASRPWLPVPPDPPEPE